MARREEHNIVAADAASFDLQLGDKVMLQPGGLDFRLHAAFLGMEKPRYLITNLDTQGCSPAIIYETLYKDNSVRLFYTTDGILKGFMTKIMAYTIAPHRHIYLTFPHSAEYFTMRRDQRHQCHIPMQLSLNGESFKGMALNISANGCAVAVDAPEDAGKALQEAALVEFSCNLIKTSVQSTAICRVMNTRRAKGKLIVGMAFEVISGIDQDRVNSFLKFLSRFSPSS